MRNAFLVVATLSSAGLGLVGGCGGGGGSGGAGTGGATATSSTTATTADVSTSASQGGAGGAGPTCNACIQTSCAADVAACQADPECAQWLTCSQACATATDQVACLDACDKPAAGYADIGAIYDCACKACATECASVDACGRACVDASPPVTMAVPATLADAGLYVGTVNSPHGAEVAAWAKAYQPRYALWSDGATKKRWVEIPACKKIDTSDMDHWSFPVGTRLWKEFTRDGVRVETRLLYRFGPGDQDWGFATYQWDVTAPDDPAKALSVTTGVIDANGTGHDIPAAPNDCLQCHGKLKEHVLGFGAIQLTHDIPGSRNIHELSTRGVLTVPAPPQGFPVPDDGTTVVSEALGYLHANCGQCHNSSMAFPNMKLRVLTTSLTPADTDTYKTAVNVATQVYPGEPYRIAGGNPAGSCVVERVNLSTMPPLASEIPDAAGAAKLSAWIQTLPPPP